MIKISLEHSKLVCALVAVMGVTLSSAAMSDNSMQDRRAQYATAPASAPAYVSALDAGVAIPEGVRVSAEDKSILRQITVQQYDLLMAGVDPATLTARDGRSVEQVIDGVQGDGIDSPSQTLGDTNSQLVYTPIEPCRIVDTGVAGGNFTAGQTRSYTIGGVTDYSSIGGSATGCTPQLPGSEGHIFGAWERVRAYHINIVAAAPAGGGNFTVWPANKSTPTASTINFRNLTPNLNIANGVIIQNCTDSTSMFDPPGAPALCHTGDLSFKANFAGARLVVDVLGYYTRADTETIQTHLGEGVLEPIDGRFLSGSCENITSCTVFPTRLSSGNVGPGKIMVQAFAQFDTLGVSSPSIGVFVSDVDGTTCSPATATGRAHFDSGTNTNGYIPMSLSTVYSLPPDTAVQQLFLNVESYTGNEYLMYSQISCLWVPN